MLAIWVNTWGILISIISSDSVGFFIMSIWNSFWIEISSINSLWIQKFAIKNIMKTKYIKRVIVSKKLFSLFISLFNVQLWSIARSTISIYRFSFVPIYVRGYNSVSLHLQLENNNKSLIKSLFSDVYKCISKMLTKMQYQ